MDPLPIAPSVDEKRAAVARVLQSRALGRAEQLRTLLRYICNAELEGKAHELNEYALGVFALGRPPNYSPAEDSCVRSRAHELRHRLSTYYQSEAPSDPIRIHIAKGGYVPRFLRAGAESKDSSPPPSSSANEPLSRFWAPFTTRDSPLLLAFEQHRAAPDFVATKDHADFGSVHAAFLLGRVLGARGSDVGLKHATALDWHDLWNSSVVFLGQGASNPIMRQLLQNRAFISDESGVIHNRQPKPDEAPAYEGANTRGFGAKYALIAKLRGPQVGRHVLVLSGCSAELIWALAETVTNPLHVAKLGQLTSTPDGEQAEEFDVLIQATFQGNVPTRIQYVAHRTY